MEINDIELVLFLGISSLAFLYLSAPLWPRLVIALVAGYFGNLIVMWVLGLLMATWPIIMAIAIWVAGVSWWLRRRQSRERPFRPF